MELFCGHCHATLPPDREVTVCPVCGGVLIPRASLSEKGDVDHRGIYLPPRHAVGGIITPR